MVTQAAGNEQELARAENQLRAMLSPDTPAPSSAEVRAMRKKIADLKNPPKRPSGADMRAELTKLQAENTALLQLKELEIENLKLKGMSQADIKKKEDEMVALKMKQVELQRVVAMAGQGQAATPAQAQAPPVDAAAQAAEQAQAEAARIEKVAANASAQQNAAASQAEKPMTPRTLFASTITRPRCIVPAPMPRLRGARVAGVVGRALPRFGLLGFVETASGDGRFVI